MADSRTLLFIPQSWPFPDASEATFIAPEVPHLTAAFERVVVAPLQGSGNPPNLPAGCQLDRRLLGSLSGPHPFATLAHLGGSGPGDDAGDGRLRHRLARASFLAVVARIRPRLAELIDAWRPHLVYTYWFHAATIAACELGLTTATRAHGYDLYEERSAHGFQVRRRWALERLALVACVSEHGRRHLAERHPGGAGRCEVHRLGVPGAIRASSWNGSRLTLVSCSAAVGLKRLDRIAETACHVAMLSGQPVHWLHLGDGPELPALREYLRTCACPGMTYDLPGTVPASEVRQRMLDAQPILFLNQSSTEGSPVGIMEAMSCGIPVCAGAVGGIPEVVAADNGLLHASDEAPAAIAAAIVALAADPARQQRLAEGALSTWRRLCDPAVNHARFAGRLRAIANAAPARLPP